MSARADLAGPWLRRLLVCGLAGAAAGAASAQEAGEEPLTLPPRIDGTPLEARLEPPPPSRRQPMDEIVVTGGNPWRLPDLGSAWRVRQADEAAEPARIEARLFPLYDPEDPTFYAPDDWAINREIRRVGFIELFRVRFGSRDR